MELIYPDIALFLLRLAVGIIFIVHGYPKITDLKNTSKFTKSIGFWPPMFWAVMLAITEFVGGIFLIVGFLTQIAALLLIVTMLVTLYFHIFKWKDSFKKGWEFNILIIAALVVIFLASSQYSLDTYLGLTNYFLNFI